MKPHVAFIGAGKLGAAVGSLVRANAAEVEFWDKNPTVVSNQRELAEVAADADVLFFCVPSWALPEAFSAVAPHARKRAVVVCVSKGIEKSTGLTSDALSARMLPGRPFAFLGGGMLAAELVGTQGGAAAIGTASAIARATLASLFRGAHLKIGFSPDVRGVALCGVLKNVYAIGLGMADGLGWGNNLKGYLAAASLREMSAMLALLGGKRETAWGPAGAGDLLATGFSQHSTHRRTGQEIAVRGKAASGCEGLVSIPALRKRLGAREKKFPVFRAIGAIVSGRAKAESLFALV